MVVPLCFWPLRHGKVGFDVQPNPNHSGDWGKVGFALGRIFEIATKTTDTCLARTRRNDEDVTQPAKRSATHPVAIDQVCKPTSQCWVDTATEGSALDISPSEQLT